MRAYALAEIGDPLAIDVLLRREDAWAMLKEILNDDPAWAGTLFAAASRFHSCFQRGIFAPLKAARGRL